MTKRVSNSQFLGLLVVLYIVVLCVFSRNMTHYPYGDGPEYILMTESFLNHSSPELKKSDVTSYLEYLDEHNFFVHKREIYERYLSESQLDYAKNPEDSIRSYGGYFLAQNGKWYSYHFWLYSLTNVPARLILDHLEADIRITFLATNLFFVFFGMWIISQLKDIKVGHRIVLVLLLTFFPALWYIDWAHAEVYAGIFTFLAVILYHTKKKYLSLFFFSISAVHYPPLFIPALFVFVNIIRKSGVSIMVLLKLFIASFWIVLPPAFYLIYFGVPNLIADSGFLSMEVVDLKRLYSFFFDLNQGMILGIPLILLITIGFLINDLFKRKFLKSYYYLLSILAMSIFFMQMTNWNHGQAVVNRYVVWNASIIIAVFYTRIANLKNAWFYGISLVVIASQIFTIFSQQEFNKYYWHANNFNKLSKYIMNNYPSLYNPDPMIFKYRLSPHELSTNSLYVYTDENGQIVKMLVEEGSIMQLVKRGIDEEKVKSLEKELNYYHGYSYINKDDLDKIGYDQSNDKLNLLLKSEKTKELKEHYRNAILNSPEWYEKVKQKAKDWGISEDSVLQLDVDYLYRKGLEKNM